MAPVKLVACLQVKYSLGVPSSFMLVGERGSLTCSKVAPNELFLPESRFVVGGTIAEVSTMTTSLNYFSLSSTRLLLARLLLSSWLSCSCESFLVLMFLPMIFRLITCVVETLDSIVFPVTLVRDVDGFLFKGCAL